jgi:hypothetical protein
MSVWIDVDFEKAFWGMVKNKTKKTKTFGLKCHPISVGALFPFHVLVIRPFHVKVSSLRTWKGLVGGE